MRTLCARVPKEKGEYFRNLFSKKQVINKDLKIKRNGRYLYIPLLSPPESLGENDDEKAAKNEIELVEMELDGYPDQINSYKALIDLPPELKSKLPTSFDIIGSIALIKIPKALAKHSNIIGEAILKVNKNLRTVASDKGVIGKFRVHDLEVIAGEPKTETLHKEYGIRLLMDISKVYYSPRLGGEHYRISQLVRRGELVLDMFAGIGPFSIMIAKYSKAKPIYSIDLNRDAIEYLIKNIDLNKVKDIFVLEGDAQRLIHRVPKADRIIMNLPIGGQKFFGSALSKLKARGTIHYHEMVDIKDFETRKAWLESNIDKYSFNILDMKINNLGSYSPQTDHYCFDLFLAKKK